MTNFRVVQEDGCFRVVPQKGLLALCIVVFAIFFPGVHFLTVYLDSNIPLPFWLMGIPIAIAVCAILGMVERAEVRRGPWFEYERKSGRSRLPRIGVEFDRSEALGIFLERRRGDEGFETDLYIKVRGSSGDKSHFVIGSKYGNEIRKLAEQMSLATCFLVRKSEGKPGADRG